MPLLLPAPNIKSSHCLVFPYLERGKSVPLLLVDHIPDCDKSKKLTFNSDRNTSLNSNCSQPSLYSAMLDHQFSDFQGKSLPFEDYIPPLQLEPDFSFGTYYYYSIQIYD